MPFDVNELIREVYRQAALQRMPPPFVTRLVKLIYLADLEWRRTHEGEPLTDLTWKFLHYGPYAIEFAELLANPEMEVKELESGKVARRFDFSPGDLDRPVVPEGIASVVRKLLKRWGDADLNTLLDHVYFDTEPMENAKRVELLDFSTVQPPDLSRPVRVDSQRLKRLRGQLKDRVKQLGLTRGGIHVPVVDLESQQAWDEDDRRITLPLGQQVHF
jgi:hypothetical protein